MNQSTSLFHTDGTPRRPLVELLEILGVQHDGTIASIRNATQTCWYQAGKFSAEIRDTVNTASRHAGLMRFFAALRLCEKVVPRLPQYDHCLLLGATVTAVRRRLAFLRDQWNVPHYGVRFRNLFLLGSERLLFSDKESPEILFNSENEDLPFNAFRLSSHELPTTEWEMMQFVHRTADLPWKKESVGFAYVHTPGVRANTGDTIQAWLKEFNPKPGSCLAVSSQPYVGYQEAVIRNILLEKFPMEAIGSAAGESTPAAVYLDTLAKQIFEEAKAHGV